MATAQVADITLTAGWTDLIATVVGLASVDVVVQNVSDGPSPIQVVFGGASAPTTSAGFFLGRFDSVSGNAAHIWVKSSLGGKVAAATI